MADARAPDEGQVRAIATPEPATPHSGWGAQSCHDLI